MQGINKRLPGTKMCSHRVGQLSGTAAMGIQYERIKIHRCDIEKTREQRGALFDAAEQDS